MTESHLIDDMVAKEQIRQAMARYSRGIDRRDEAMVRSAYHEDSFDEHGWGLSAGGWDFATLVRRDGNGFPDEWKQTTHFLGQHLIEVDGDAAVSEVHFTQVCRLEDESGAEWDWQVGGRYLDVWSRRDGEFRISRRKVVYDWQRTDPVQHWPGPDTSVPKMYVGGDALSTEGTYFGSSGPDDPSYALFD